jgi:N-acetylmuramoyl-L-alanine amidase
LSPRPATRRELLVYSALGLAGACTGPRPRPSPEPLQAPEPTRADPLPAADPLRVLVACGRRHPLDTRVVQWSEPGGYDASRTALAFPADPPADPPAGLRYQPGRTLAGGATVGPQADLAELRGVVDQFVLHFDACGTSRRCFQVLHDRRKLSVHFLLDLDGTLYQTLDLVHTAWHARQANARSVGVEIANIGAYPPDEAGALEEWYARDASGTRVVLPADQGDGGLRTPGFVARPRRDRPVRGSVQGRSLVMYDYTPEQYRALAKLAAALARLFPLLALEVPRHAAGAQRGRVRDGALDDAEFAAFRGILGHQHVSADKVDPGPAFHWEEFLHAARREYGNRAPRV